MPIIRTSSIVLMTLLTVLLLSGPTFRPAPVEQMPQGQIRIDGQVVTARLAITRQDKAQGFQGAPAQIIATEMIYFSWQRAIRPVFHMRNVSQPVAIAWIDAAGEVVGMDTMQPGKGGYRPPEPIRAALEMAPAQANSLKIRPGTRIERATRPGNSLTPRPIPYSQNIHQRDQ